MHFKRWGRLTRRGRIWFGYVYENGVRRQVNTHCTDRQAAMIELRRLEQEAADPRQAAAARTTLRQVLEMLVEHRWSEAKAGKRAPETARFYAKKAGVLLRLFGENFRLAQLDAPAVDAYVRARRDEGTSDHTIHKELTTLRAALRLALRARLWSGMEAITKKRGSAIVRCAGGFAIDPLGAPEDGLSSAIADSATGPPRFDMIASTQVA